MVFYVLRCVGLGHNAPALEDKMNDAVTDRPSVGQLRYSSSEPMEGRLLAPVSVYAGEEAGWRNLGICVGGTVVRHNGRLRVAVVYDAGPEPGK